MAAEEPRKRPQEHQEMLDVQEKLRRLLDGEKSDFGWRSLSEDASVVYVNIWENKETGAFMAGVLEWMLQKQGVKRRRSEESVQRKGGYVVYGNDLGVAEFIVDWKAMDNMCKHLSGGRDYE